MLHKSAHIIALVTTHKEQVLNSGAPVIWAKNEDELQILASELGKIMKADVHRLANGVVVLTEV